MSELDFSSYSNDQLAFESIGGSVWQALYNLSRSQLAGNLLLECYFESRGSLPSMAFSQKENLSPIFEKYGEIEEESVYLHWKDMKRSTLVTAISILDAFLSDALRFSLLRDPGAIPTKGPKREARDLDPEYLDMVLRKNFMSQDSRMKFLKEKFVIECDQATLAELRLLTALRNQIAHHGSFYKLGPGPSGEVVAEEKPLPTVSYEQSAKASMLVAEVCDSVFVQMSLKLFGRLPQVRPLTTESTILLQRLKRCWADEKLRPTLIEEFPEPGWSLRSLSDESATWVGDEYLAFLIRPTGLEILPVLMDFLWNKRHGTAALVSVDEGPFENVKSSAKEVLARMLKGSFALVEFHDDKQDEARYARFSLHGFAETWSLALRKASGPVEGGSEQAS